LERKILACSRGWNCTCAVLWPANGNEALIILLPRRNYMVRVVHATSSRLNPSTAQIISTLPY
jgi:hypothetical protein